MYKLLIGSLIDWKFDSKTSYTICYRAPQIDNQKPKSFAILSELKVNYIDSRTNSKLVE